MTKFEYTITEDDKGIPVKNLMRQKFSFSSRLLTKLKFQHLVFLNGEPVAGWITPAAGDVLSVKLPEEKSEFPAEDIPISAVYEDDDLIIVNKQPGVTVHPTKGHPDHTIANGLMKYMADTNQQFKIRFVNRLDMDTSGLLIVSKNSHGQDNVTKQMKANIVKKKYVAVVHGLVDEDSFTVNLPIGKPEEGCIARAVLKEGGYPSITHVKVLKRYSGPYGDFSICELLLETGRTHQIRVHMSHIGHPLVGDTLYGGDDTLLKRQALHAYSLSFNHPVTGEKLQIEAPLPDDIMKLIEKIK